MEEMYMIDVLKGKGVLAQRDCLRYLVSRSGRYSTYLVPSFFWLGRVYAYSCESDLILFRVCPVLSQLPTTYCHKVSCCLPEA
jgi:hypothetical protein